jgi:NADPH:quinone reductase-like Zn-dependent oxidoreductase
MKAVVYRRYGPPEGLRLQEVPRPTPAADEVLIKLVAVSVNRSDWEALIGHPLYARIGGLRPILGSDIAGRVEQVGSNVRRFQPGDEVFGDILWRKGGFAEYVCARERALVAKPAGLTFAQAAALPQAGVIALQGIRDKGQVQPGQQVLINGAGGGAGMFAVQLTKQYGAAVTGVDHAGKQEFLRALGADQVLDYTRHDFTRIGQRYDLILDLVALRSAFAYERALRRGGRYYAVGGAVPTGLQLLLLGRLLGRATGKQIGVLAVQPNRSDLAHLAEQCQAGQLVPHIDRCYPLSRVPDALRYVGEGHVKGKVVITME